MLKSAGTGSATMCWNLYAYSDKMMTGCMWVYNRAVSLFRGSIGAAVLGFGFDVADASMVTLLAIAEMGSAG